MPVQPVIINKEKIKFLIVAKLLMGG